MEAKAQEPAEQLAGSPDAETLFVAEIRARRERLAQWIQMIQDEIRRNDATIRQSRRPAHECRGAAPRRSR